VRTQNFTQTDSRHTPEVLNNFWIAGRNFASCACCCRVALPTHSTRPGANTPFLSTPFSDETRSFAKTGSGQTSGKLRKRGRCRYTDSAAAERRQARAATCTQRCCPGFAKSAQFSALRRLMHSKHFEYLMHALVAVNSVLVLAELRFEYEPVRYVTHATTH
jgi:hypothetical protein